MNQNASNPDFRTPPHLGFAAWSGTGKTTLLCKLIPLLVAKGLKVALIKHAHHDFDIDHPGKDSFELRRAGAERVLIASRRRSALMVENPTETEPELEHLLIQARGEETDLILVEGFKHEAFPKIELHRPEVGKPLLCTEDRNIIAVATTATAVVPAHLPRLLLDDVDTIATFVSEWRQEQRHHSDRRRQS
jgi:molybdopterin-guanine dinucleotide biosynthesis protein B